MTLDEAIKHAEEVAKSRCDECGREHNQLVLWLKELKEYREQEPCRKDCRLCKEFDECENGKKGHENGTSIGYSIGECKDYEPCDDAVIRKAVLKRIAQFSTEEGSSVVCQPLYSDVNNMPSVTPSRQWIPVSERLPEDAFGCLVTVYDTDLRTQDEYANILPYFVGYDGETWNNADGEPIPFEVVAWMPLPEPYKAQGSE